MKNVIKVDFGKKEPVLNRKFELGKRYVYSNKMAEMFQDEGHYVYIRRECEGREVIPTLFHWNDDFSDVVGILDGVMINPEECIEV